jgi:hypothetical protein
MKDEQKAVMDSGTLPRNNNEKSVDNLCERCDEVSTYRFCRDCLEEISYNEEQANPSDGLGY